MNANDASTGYDLCEYTTGDLIRPATHAEVAESLDAAEFDGGHGVIVVEINGEPVNCYVE